MTSDLSNNNFTTTGPEPLASDTVQSHQPAIESEPMSNDNTTIEFRRLRDTKNTVRFEEETTPGKPPVIGTIYIQKWFAGDTDKLTVTITKEGK